MAVRAYLPEGEFRTMVLALVCEVIRGSIELGISNEGISVKRKWLYTGRESATSSVVFSISERRLTHA
jgi:hypothetical protein